MLQSCLIMSDYRFKGKPVLLCFLLHFSIVLIKDCIPCHFMRRCQRFNQSQNKLYDTRKCVSWWLERKGEEKKVCRLWLRGQHLSLPERHFNEPKICLVYSSCQHLIFPQIQHTNTNSRKVQKQIWPTSLQYTKKQIL